jgi:DNA-binding CsgD family transcriptional regulator
VFDADTVSLCALLAAIEGGDYLEVDRWIERPIAQRGWANSAVVTARRQIAHAERDVRGGKLDSAVDCLDQATTLLVEIADPFIETLVRLRRADVLLRRGAVNDDEAAAAELAAVVPFWRRVQATWYLGQLRVWAKQRHLPFPRVARSARRAGAPMAELTSRERQVAMLVGQGLTNREIATRLVISERTAEGHIEQIRNKLGVRNRSLIAVWATADRS